MCINNSCLRSMLINRDIEKELKLISNSYPVMTITGHRQSGKTTPAKKYLTIIAIAILNIPK